MAREEGLVVDAVAGGAPVVLELQLFTAGAVEDLLPGFLGQVLPGGGEGEAVLQGHGVKVHPGDGVGLDGVPAHNLDGALGQALFLVGDDEILVGHQLHAKAGAGRAGAVGVVEGEHPGRELRHGHAAVVAGVVFREEGEGVVVHAL